MNNVRISTCLALLIVCAGGLSAVEELPVKIAPGDAKLNLQGAWSEDFRGAWEGIGFKLRTDATAMNILLTDDMPGGSAGKLGGMRSSYVAIQVDDGEVQSLPVDNASGRVAVPGLDGQVHTVVAFKESEPIFGTWTFKGVELAAGGQLLDPPAPSAVRMQVIGDSISAGYGNMTANHKAPHGPSTDKAWNTYWAFAARALGADVRCAAWSGQGAFRNNRGSIENQMPDLWQLAVPGARKTQQTPERAGVSWQPTVAVINLGTNDAYSKAGPGSEAEFGGAIKRMIADLRALNPEVEVILCFGPMIGKNDDPRKQTQVAVGEYLRAVAAADDKVQVVVLSNQHGMKGVGTHWHPSALSHESMSKQLLAAIKGGE